MECRQPAVGAPSARDRGVAGVLVRERAGFTESLGIPSLRARNPARHYAEPIAFR